MLANEVINEIYNNFDGSEFSFPVLSRRDRNGGLSFECEKAKHINGMLVSIGYGETSSIDETGNCLVVAALSEDDIQTIIGRKSVDMSYGILLFDFHGIIGIRGYSGHDSMNLVIKPLLEFVSDKDLRLHLSSETIYDTNFNARLILAMKKDLGIQRC